MTKKQIKSPDIIQTSLNEDVDTNLNSARAYAVTRYKISY